MSIPHEERLARNEAAFRELNESLGRDVHARLADGERAQLHGFFCECGNPDCNEIMRLATERYEAARADPCLFLVLPGHEISEVEDVVDREEGSVMVRKHAEVADVVRETDPRH